MNFNNDTLKKISNKIRLNVIKSLYIAQSGHPGSSLSVIEILVYLFFINKKKPRIILSKGHAAPALYSLLYEKKIINKKNFFNLRKINSITQGHPDFARLKFVDASTGALGQGLTIAIGYCIANNIKKLIGYYIPTQRNIIVKDHYKNLGFRKANEVTGTEVWELDVEKYIYRENYISHQSY